MLTQNVLNATIEYVLSTKRSEEHRFFNENRKYSNEVMNAVVTCII